MVDALRRDIDINDILKGVQISLEGQADRYPWCIKYYSRARTSAGKSEWGDVDVETSVAPATLNQLVFVVGERVKARHTWSWYLWGPRLLGGFSSVKKYLQRVNGPLVQRSLIEPDYPNVPRLELADDSKVPEAAQACRQILSESPPLNDDVGFANWTISEHCPSNYVPVYRHLQKAVQSVRDTKRLLIQLADNQRNQQFGDEFVPAPSYTGGLFQAPKNLRRALQVMYAQLSLNPDLRKPVTDEKYDQIVDRFGQIEDIVKNTICKLDGNSTIDAEYSDIEELIQSLNRLIFEELWPPAAYLISMATARGPRKRELIEKRQSTLRVRERGEEDNYGEQAKIYFQLCDRIDAI